MRRQRPFAAASLAAFAIGYGQSFACAQTMTFGVLALSQLVYAFSVRSENPLLSVGVFSNKYLWGAALASGFVALLVMLVPGLRDIFELTSLTGLQWLFVFLLTLAPFAGAEAEKLVMWLLKKYTNIEV